MALSAPFDHYFRDSENQENRTEVLSHYCVEISKFLNILCSGTLLFSRVQVYPDTIKRSCPFYAVTCFIEDAADVFQRQLSGNSATAVPVQLIWYSTVQHFHLK